MARLGGSYFSGTAISSATLAGRSSAAPRVRVTLDDFDEKEPAGPIDNDTVPKRRICVFVEPSPFTYICGYKNRFENLIRYLREGGDEVLVITTHSDNEPKEFCGAEVFQAKSFVFPFYPLPLSLAMSPRIYNKVKAFNPDLIHCCSPGFMCFAALLYAKMRAIPLVLSYHTHVPKYIPDYVPSMLAWLVKPMWSVLRFLHQAADLTLVTSTAMGKELISMGATMLAATMVWKRGVDADIFNPRHKSEAMRARLCGGDPSRKVVVHVGRLGAEKNLFSIKDMMAQLPGTRLAFVGDGPVRKELEAHFEGTDTVFLGMCRGDELSQAYASADAFIMPSESETLGFVVLEAMASGVPVVASRAGGIPDIVNADGVNGFLYTPGNTEAGIQEAAGHLRVLLYEDTELAARVGAAGRAEVSRWDWRAATQHLRKVQYASAIAAHAKSCGKSLPEGESPQGQIGGAPAMA